MVVSSSTRSSCEPWLSLILLGQPGNTYSTMYLSRIRVVRNNFDRSCHFVKPAEHDHEHLVISMGALVSMILPSVYLCLISAAGKFSCHSCAQSLLPTRSTCSLWRVRDVQSRFSRPRNQARKIEMQQDPKCKRRIPVLAGVGRQPSVPWRN